MRRILYYCDSLEWGGAEIYLQRLISRLTNKDTEIHLAVPRGDAYEQFSRCLDGYNVNLHPYEADRGSFFPTVWQTWKIVRKVQPQLVHFNLAGFSSCRYSIWAFQWLWHIPSVVTIQLLNRSSLRPRRLGRTAFYNYLTRRAMQNLKKIIVVSEEMKKQLTEQEGVEARANIEVIRNAVDSEIFVCDHGFRLEDRSRWGLSTTDFVIVMVARLDEQQKAQTAALDALREVPTEPRRSVLLLVGNGPSRGMLEARAAELGIGDRVIFTGRLSTVQPALNMADVAILPSRNEGLPFALLEAMASGLPVIASRIAGIPEVVEDGVSGLLIKPADAQELRSKLCLLYRDNELRARLGRAAQETVRIKFSL
ncbi:MAG TPA: glycosyltransferase family 4 protein, partial [Candidatus Saccharimonadales bacterium]|nr:glycosyltransferase family 4 protein [Candidatus Saccharimonadales bacterium]